MADQPPPYSSVEHEKSGLPDASAPPPTGVSQYPPPPGSYSYPPPAGAPAYPPAQPVGGSYPAQAPGPYQAQPGVVVVAPGMIRPGAFPANMRCPFCQADIITATQHETGGLVFILSGVMCLLGCWLGCCLIPFCMDGCKDVVHTCPNCSKQITRYNRL